MRQRTNDEIKAYADGYNDCFKQFCDCLRGRKSVMDSVRKMRLYKEAVNAVVSTKGDEDGKNNDDIL